MKDGKKSSSDALALWNTYGETYYHELNHFAGLINDTHYADKPEGTLLMRDTIYPYNIARAAKDLGTKGRWQRWAGSKMHYSTIYLDK